MIVWKKIKKLLGNSLRMLRDILITVPVLRKMYKRLFVLWTKYKDKRKRKELQKFGCEALHRIFAAVGGTGIRVFCAYGTLLGIVRDNNFIKHDTDMDFCILPNESFTWEKLERVLKRNGFRKTRYFTHDGAITEETYMIHHLNVDFFLCEKVKGGMRNFGYYRFESEDYPDENGCTVVECRYPEISNLIEYKFKGETVFIPQNPEKFLEAAYGPNWRIPDPNYCAPIHKVSNSGRGYVLEKEFL